MMRSFAVSEVFHVVGASVDPLRRGDETKGR